MGAVSSFPHFKFPELRLLGFGAPKIGPKGDRRVQLLGPFINLLAPLDRALDILNDLLRKMILLSAFDALDERDERHVEKGAGLRNHRNRLLARKIGVFDRTHAGLQTPPHPFIRVDMRHDIGAPRGRFFHCCGKFRFRELIARRMTLGGKHHPARDEHLELTGALAQFLARRLAHLIDAVHDDGHHGKRADVARRDRSIQSACESLRPRRSGSAPCRNRTGAGR